MARKQVKWCPRAGQFRGMGGTGCASFTTNGWPFYPSKDVGPLRVCVGLPHAFSPGLQPAAAGSGLIKVGEGRRGLSWGAAGRCGVRRSPPAQKREGWGGAGCFAGFVGRGWLFRAKPLLPNCWCQIAAAKLLLLLP